MSPANVQPSRSGIVTDANGQRSIPSSTRADGTTRREIKVRPGYKPPEDVELYKSRATEALKTRGKGSGVPGADAAEEQEIAGPSSSNKNAKRREARRKAKATTDTEATAKEQTAVDTTAEGQGDGTNGTKELQTAVAGLTLDPDADKEKKVKRAKKKLREARDLQQKKENGEGLLPEQLQKALRISDLVQELESLGYNAEGEPISS